MMPGSGIIHATAPAALWPTHPYTTTDAMVAKAKRLLSLYDEMGVTASKLIFRVPATWAGLQAAASLEADGIATQAFHIYR